MGNIVDSLGRFTVPIKYRKMMDIHPGDELNVSYKDGTLLVKKENLMCVFCGSTKDLFPFEERQVCKECMEILKESYDQLKKKNNKIIIHRKR